jgi:uncharacterized protein (DUF779 family)
MTTVRITAAAADIVARVRAERSGPLTFMIDGGCCEGAAPHLYEHAVITSAVRAVGDAAGVPVFLQPAMIEPYAAADVTIDVADEPMSEAMSLRGAGRDGRRRPWRGLAGVVVRAQLTRPAGARARRCAAVTPALSDAHAFALELFGASASLAISPKLTLGLDVRSDGVGDAHAFAVGDRALGDAHAFALGLRAHAFRDAYAFALGVPARRFGDAHAFALCL